MGVFVTLVTCFSKTDPVFKVEILKKQWFDLLRRYAAVMLIPVVRLLLSPKFEQKGLVSDFY